MNFLTKHSKAFYYAYGILIGIMIVLAVFYLTQYKDIRVLYTIPKGAVEILASTEDSTHASNQYLFDYFTNGNANGLVAATGLSTNFEEYKFVVYDFQVLLSKINDRIVLFGVLSLVCFALLLVLSNHNRRIYYKSNLIGGIVLPLIVVVLNLVLVIQNLNAMGIFNKNEALFNIVAQMQSDSQIRLSQMNYSEVATYFSCNDLSFILYTVLFVIVISYSVFMIIYAVLKYKATAEERAEIEKKAAVNND